MGIILFNDGISFLDYITFGRFEWEMFQVSLTCSYLDSCLQGYLGRRLMGEVAGGLVDNDDVLPLVDEIFSLAASLSTFS